MAELRRGSPEAGRELTLMGSRAFGELARELVKPANPQSRSSAIVVLAQLEDRRVVPLFAWFCFHNTDWLSGSEMALLTDYLEGATGRNFRNYDEFVGWYERNADGVKWNEAVRRFELVNP